jgi:acetyl esterase
MSIAAALRRRAGSAVIDSFFQGASRLGRLHPLAQPERYGLEVIRDVPYTDSGREEHQLDVYRPTAPSGTPPAMLYLHGGGFRILSKDTHWVMGLGYARRGIVVFNASYRLAPKHRFPTPLEDAVQAYRWVVENAARYGADPNHIIVAGESAGANLAASVALMACFERAEPIARSVFDTGVVPRAVLPACGIFQVSDVERFARRKKNFPRFILDRLHEVELAYLGKEYAHHGALLDFADPVRWVERGDRPSRPLPPFFLPVGTRDPLLDDTRRLAQALRALGTTADDRYYEGEVHAFHALVMLRAARQCWKDSYDFLDRHCGVWSGT